MNLFFQLLAGTMMIGLTVTVHGTMLDFVMRNASAWEVLAKRATKRIYKPIMSIAIVLMVFLAHIIEIWLWAGLFLLLECLPQNTLSEALYFSTITYTTLGYGDITLAPDFRIMSGIEAANGFLLFGWTTAFIFEVMSRIYKHEIKSL